MTTKMNTALSFNSKKTSATPMIDDGVATFNRIQVKTDKELILLRPEVNIGSVAIALESQWVLSASLEMELREISYIPALLKLFDEVLVNARDHSVRMASKIAEGVLNSLPVTFIDVVVNDGTITVTNDGNGMDVAIHPDIPGVYIPEIAFAHLRSSSHYDDTEENTFGGQNGLGAKLTYIWSSFGQIETVDHVRKLKYVQTFRNNLDIIEPPIITKCPAKTKPYTKITFRPDYARLQSPLTSDMIALIQRRTFDIAAVTDPKIKVKFNGELVPVKNFQQYVNLFIGAKGNSRGNNKKDEPGSETASAIGEEIDTKSIVRIYDFTANGRWEYIITASPTREFVQVSFVNGIYTYKGGKHVDYITEQITAKVAAFIEKKKKIKVNTASIKAQLMIFVRCDIVKPKFASQTKEDLTTPVAQLRAVGGAGGGGCTVSDAIAEKIAKQLGVMDTACAITEAINSKHVAKQVDGGKTRRIKGISKLTDATYAGTARSGECTLILTEGDSAKSAVESGLTPTDRLVTGVFPLKGKAENVRGKKSTEKFSEEVVAIIKILGLKLGTVYTNTDTLRYAKVLFVTDQDLDGSHIKGLGINIFHSLWRSLTLIPNFLGYMNTPILKAWPKHGQKTAANTVQFYSEGQFNKWKALQSNMKNWKTKYYKGLGTSDKAEFMQYMRDKRVVSFAHTGNPSDDAIDMAFNKKRAIDRKPWIKRLNAQSEYADTECDAVSYELFINNELVWFSKYDCERSIGSVMDGFKPSLRKVLYSCIKRNLKNEIKVAQLAGYVSEQSAYHHGEASLVGTIIGMAQRFLGSNNVNLLVPAGQFGTRIMGGDDAASPRYIFTCLDAITRILFPKIDDSILHYLKDDGMRIEPKYYAPIVPLVLVNGCKGLGTGFSTDVLQYNIVDLIAHIRLCLNNPGYDRPFLATPYYEGFKGSITPIRGDEGGERSGGDDDARSFLIKGVYNTTAVDTICVTELPIGIWNDAFKERLEELNGQMTEKKAAAEKKATAEDKKAKKDSKAAAPAVLVKEFDSTLNSDTSIKTYVTFAPGQLAKLEAKRDTNGVNGVEKLLGLAITKSVTNMHLFNAQGELTKYETVNDIMREYFDVRLTMYQMRKTRMLADIQVDIDMNHAKSRFIRSVIDRSLVLSNRPMEEIVAQMQADGYPAEVKKGKEGEEDDVVIEEDEDNEEEGTSSLRMYDYLLNMPLRTLTKVKADKLSENEAQSRLELVETEAITIQQMWLNDLDALGTAYTTHIQERNIAESEEAVAGPVAKSRKKAAPRKPKVAVVK